MKILRFICWIFGHKEDLIVNKLGGLRLISHSLNSFEIAKGLDVDTLAPLLLTMILHFYKLKKSLHSDGMQKA